MIVLRALGWQRLEVSRKTLGRYRDRYWSRVAELGLVELIPVELVLVELVLVELGLVELVLVELSRLQPEIEVEASPRAEKASVQ